MAWFYSNRKFDSELQYHVDRLTEDNIKAGMSPAEARRQAIIQFGGPEQMKEELRDIHRLPLIETAWKNVRFAFRLMRKSTVFSITIIVTLALGIGANSAVFSAVNAILLRPLPFPGSDRIVQLQQVDRTLKAPPIFVAPVRLEDWNRLNTTFEAIAGYYTEDVSDISGSLPEKVTAAMVSPRFFQIWDIPPALGRFFSPAEEHFGGPNAVIISHRYWVHRFNTSSAVIGQQIHLEHSSFTVVGVMPANFAFRSRDVDIWEPSPADAPFAQSRESTWYTVYGRLKPFVPISEATSNIATVQALLGRQFPRTDRQLAITVQPLKQIATEDSSRSLWLLFAAVSLLLLIACTNIAALLLARASRREREISIRLSVGASRGAIVYQLLTECFVLALVGSGLGLFIAYEGSALFRHFAKAFPRTEEITLDWRIVLYTFGSAFLVTILFGLIPAIHSTRRTPVSARHPMQWLLAGTQMALAVTLLSAAGLTLRSFQELGKISPGFESSHVLTFRISGNYGETTNYKALIQRIDRTLDSIRATPGVLDAATSATLPGLTADSKSDIKILDHAQTKTVANTRFVSDGYFNTLRIPVLAGQGCARNEQQSGAVVNRAFAVAYLPNPIGSHINLVSNDFQLQPGRITGLVEDAREQGLDRSPVPTVYWCGSAPFPTPYFLVRTQGSPMSMAETLRRKIQKLEPFRSVFWISPLDEHLSDHFAQDQLRASLLTAFSLTAVALACAGLYGTVSYGVAVRRKETGLRLALGATRKQIVFTFLVQGLTASILGCAAGLCTATFSSKLLAGMLFGVRTTDPATLAGVTALVLILAVVATLVPAFRASTVEPMRVLRQE